MFGGMGIGLSRPQKLLNKTTLFGKVFIYSLNYGEATHNMQNLHESLSHAYASTAVIGLSESRQAAKVILVK